MTFNVFSGTLNPAQSVVAEKHQRDIWGRNYLVTPCFYSVFSEFCY